MSVFQRILDAARRLSLFTLPAPELRWGKARRLEDRPAANGLPEVPPRLRSTRFMDAVLAFGVVLAIAGFSVAAIDRASSALAGELILAGAALAGLGVLCAFAARAQLAADAEGEPAMRTQPPDWGVGTLAGTFFGGVAGGAFFIAGLTDFFLTDSSLQPIARHGYLVSLVAILLCLPCRIADLGRLVRLRNFLIAFPPGSPASLGSWMLPLLAGFALTATVQAFPDSLPLGARVVRGFTEWVPRRFVGLAGVLPAAFVAAGPGIALGGTFRPPWLQSRVLGALFFLSGVLSGLAAILGAMLVAAQMFGPVHTVLGRIGVWTGAIEMLFLLVLLALLGPWASHLIGGRRAPAYWLGVAGFGVFLPVWLHQANARSERLWRELGSEQGWLILGSLTGAFLLRWVVLSAGQEERGPGRRPSRAAEGRSA